MFTLLELPRATVVKAGHTFSDARPSGKLFFESQTGRIRIHVLPESAQVLSALLELPP